MNALSVRVIAVTTASSSEGFIASIVASLSEGSIAATSAALLDNDKCPKLTARGIIHRGIKISSDSVPARTLKEHSPWRFALEFQTPRGSLAGLSLDGVVKVLQENTRTAMDVSLFDD